MLVCMINIVCTRFSTSDQLQ